MQREMFNSEATEERRERERGERGYGKCVDYRLGWLAPDVRMVTRGVPERGLRYECALSIADSPSSSIVQANPCRYRISRIADTNRSSSDRRCDPATGDVLETSSTHYTTRTTPLTAASSKLHRFGFFRFSSVISITWKSFCDSS